MGFRRELETEGDRISLVRYLWLRRMTLPSPPYQICDIGAGMGATCLRYCVGDFNGIDDIGMFGDVRGHGGLDVREECNVASRKMFPTAEFVTFDLLETMNGKQIPFADNRWDCVIASEVMEHLPKDAWIPVLGEIKRIMKHVACFTMPDGGKPKRTEDYFPQHPRNQAYIGHQYEPCLASWVSILKQSFGENVYCGRIPHFFTAIALKESV